MNVYDSDVLKSILTNHNYSIADSPESADLIVINTCSVRQKAEIRALGHIKELKQYKASNPNLKIAVVGCMAQRMQADLLKELPFVDLVLGTERLFGLPVYLEKLEKSQIVDTSFSSCLPNGIIPSSHSQYCAFVAISRGCDNFCSYCIVPYVRGKEKHRPSHEILQEVRKLAQGGYKEVTLLGQNVNSYKDEAFDFADLLQRISDGTDISWIRFMTSHPNDLSSKLIDKISNSSKVCEHLHLPLQSGSDFILQRMNRNYTASGYLKLIEQIRDKAGDICLTTDIMVGFPGETLSDFQKTLGLVEKIRFDAAFTFHYSPRERTKAAGFEDDVPQKEKVRRLGILIQLQKEISLQRNQRFVGQGLEILVDGYSKKDKARLKGKTRTNKTVVLDRKEDFLGSFRKVKITSANPWTLFGELQ